jgi:predicted lipoprotein with Yx(FWY)xxD motif
MNYRMIALSMTALAAFAGCGGGSNGTTPSPAAVTPQTTPMSTPAPTATPAGATALGTASFTTATRGAQTGFAGTNGFAVYNFDLDLTTPGTSACTGQCVTFWPPIIEPAGKTYSAPFGTITRADGTLQLAYNGHPLYMYAQDTTAGNASGDGLTVSGGLWHLAQAASLTTAATPAPSSTPTTAPTTTPIY